MNVIHYTKMLPGENFTIYEFTLIVTDTAASQSDTSLDNEAVCKALSTRLSQLAHAAEKGYEDFMKIVEGDHAG